MAIALLDDLVVGIGEMLQELSLVVSLLHFVMLANVALVRRLIVLRFAVPFSTRHGVLLELNPSENTYSET